MFKDIPFTNHYYSCDEFGNIKSNQRVIMRKNNILQTIHERILKPKTNNQGYLYVTLCYDGKIKDYLIHRLIAITWLDNPNNLATVNHIDGNPKNNTLTNLEWMSQSDNNKHSYNVLKRKPINCKSCAMLDKNKNIIKIFDSCSEASRFLFNDTHAKGNISIACQNSELKRYGYYWKYIDIEKCND